MPYLCRFFDYSECPMGHGDCAEVCQIEPEREEPPEGDPPGVPG